MSVDTTPSRAASSSCSSSFLSSVLSVASKFKFNGNSLATKVDFSKAMSFFVVFKLTLQHAFNLGTLGNVFRNLRHPIDDRSTSVMLKEQHHNLLNSRISIQLVFSVQSVFSIQHPTAFIQCLTSN